MEKEARSLKKNSLAKVKNGRSDNKVVMHKCFEKKECNKTYDRHGRSNETRKKEKKNEALENRKRGRRLNVSSTGREKMRKCDIY